MGRELLFGTTGEDVRLLQRLLNHHLYPALPKLNPDGIFGQKTRSRVVEFQTRNRCYPERMPFPPETAREYRKPLKKDGIVGPLTSHVLFDFRTLYTPKAAKFYPTASKLTEETAPFRLTAADGDPPDPQPPPQPPPNRTIRTIQLQIGQQATVNPWSLSPFVLTAQYTLLVKNEGKPDFLLTAGGQAALNDGGANGRWSGQGFVQMGLGGFDKLKLFGNRLDWFNPFVAAMLQQNFQGNFTQAAPASIGLGIGNQATWTLLSRPDPADPKGRIDTLSLFLNAQAVTNVNLSNGHGSAPSGQFLIGVTKTFVLF